MVLRFDGECYWKSLEIIEDHVAALAQQEEEKMKEKQTKASKRKAQVILDDHIIIPGSIYERWLNDPTSLIRKRRRVKGVDADTTIYKKLIRVSSTIFGLREYPNQKQNE
jgi:hypothetical protein